MRLIDMEIKNYNRLYVGGITSLKYRPNKNMQIILASNASGKSSLLKEIIPNVDNLNVDYDASGYRVARYIHNNKHYTLSYTRDSNKHSFIVDDIEFNQAGLKKTQGILIEEHFGINKHIHELLLSTTTFTNMSISERKKWFTEILSNIDYEYALDLYNKVKIKVRDLTSFIKLIQSKILKDEEYFKTITDDDIQLLQKDRDIFVTLVDDFISMKFNIKSINKPDIEAYYKHSDNLKRMLSKVEKYDLTYKDIEDTILTLTIDNKHTKDTISKIDDEIKEISLIDFNNGSFNTVELNSKINDIDNILSKITLTSFSTIDELIYKIESFKTIYTRLNEYIINLVEFVDIDIRERQTVEESILLYTNKLNSIENSIRTIERDIDKQLSYKENGDVTCPKCSNIFIPNYIVGKTDELNSILKTKYKERDILKDKILNNKIHLDKIKHKSSILDNIYVLLSTVDNSIKNDILKLLKDESNIEYTLSNYYITLPDVDKLLIYKKDKDRCVKELEILSNISKDKLISNRILKDKLLKDKTDMVISINENNNKISFYKKLKTVYDNILKHKEYLENTTTDIIKYRKINIEKNYNDLYNDLIMLTKKEISIIDEKLARHKNIEEHHKNLLLELETYKIELKTNKKLEEYLSPNKGIIGNAIGNTINVVLEKMNFIINQIWTNDITIQPCDVSNSDLNYKFPVVIGKLKTIPDIIKGSSSIKEIIDLAFKITAMELLNMLDYPLILDEFSKTMDSTHRIMSYDYIEKLSKEYFSQIYMVSHYHSMYSRFTNVDVVVLNNDNINYTDTHNEVITIN